MSARRSELTRQAARLFAQKGYHGTSIGDIAEALGVQKGSLYSHISSKEDLLYDTLSEGAAAFHASLDTIPDDSTPVEKIRLALRGHLRVVAEQLDVATVFVQKWRYLGDLRSDLDEVAAALLLLSAANWAYTWLQPGRETDALADRFLALLVDGMRGYSTPA
jgi:AcrR family transcriptional regulator